MNLNSPLRNVKGVGDKTAEKLANAGLATIQDILMFLPRKHEDYSAVTTISNIQPGKITIRARCEKISTRRVRKGLSITTAALADETGKLSAVWYNQPYREQHYTDTTTWHYFSGDYSFSYNRYQLSNPSSEKEADIPFRENKIIPIYRQISGVKSQLIRKVIAALRPLITMLPETLPPWLIEGEGFVGRSEALLGMHFPSSQEDIARARERLAYEEVFQLLLASQLNRMENTKLEGWSIPFDKKAVADFVSTLPFSLTGAQRRAAWDIIQDFEKTTPMNRLLQGDVGSGKTVVAGIAALQAASKCFQTAIMAPTEILARQHANTLTELLEPQGVTVGLLTSVVKGAARRQLLGEVESGGVSVLVGTHSLLQPTVTFHKLGFVAIDEQHRFGVSQRQELLQKSTHMPHMLAMTATPIPRSLALTLYGELDISVIHEKPANRQPIYTKLWPSTRRAELYSTIDQEIQKGRQVYVICNLIDECEDNDLKSVTAEYNRLHLSIFKHRKIGLLHGKLKPTEKEEVMKRFASGDLDILVSTTVVEVGVDVPNATVMLVEDAERFGLSQLHQLRGRVGRSDLQSYCYLLQGDDKKPSERLRAIEKSSDGFYLAEVDLKLRGPGEIYGKAQHGALNLQIATLADTDLIARASRKAKEFMSRGEDLLQYKQLGDQVQYYQRLTTLN